ncbi:MAG: beta-ribofuranosylaminobenzene 5'-phosphate synthase [Archaeoglobaceae archaeon]
MRVKTGARIHVTLIDLNGAIGRVDGGVGFAINEPSIEVMAKESDEIRILGNAKNFERFEKVSKKLKEIFGHGIEIEVLADYRAHVGLGSGTQVSLAVGKAYSELYGLGLSVREIATIVERGGTSGIGVSVFEHGGFIVDGGHRWEEKRGFLPSSVSKAKPAPMISRLEFPDWKVVLAIPELSGAYGLGEVDLFKSSCPIPLEDVRELCHIILMKLLPAVAEKDLDSFNEAIGKIQRVGFKKIEVKRYGSLIRDLLETLPIGMSSTGPSVYAVVDSNAKQIAKEIKDYFAEKGIESDVLITSGKNRGAEIAV